MTNFARIFLVMVCVGFCQQAEASTTKQVIDSANERFKDLSEIVQNKGPETIVNSINTGQEKAYQNHPIGSVVIGDAASGGHMIWVEGGKVIAASSASSEIGKNVEADPLVVAIIAALRASQDEKVVVSYDNGKKTAVAWGRKALMGGKVDDKMPKFFCYVAFDNPGT